MDAQTIVSGMVAAFALGLLVGAVVYEVWVVEPLRRVSDVDRVRLIRAQARDRVHLGTPYLPRVEFPQELRDSLVALESFYPDNGTPGLRVVDGEPLYSADWLSDDTTEARA